MSDQLRDLQVGEALLDEVKGQMKELPRREPKDYEKGLGPFHQAEAGYEQLLRDVLLARDKVAALAEARSEHAQWLLGLSYFREGQLLMRWPGYGPEECKKALLAFQKSLEYNDEEAAAHYNAGLCFLELGNKEGAVAHFGWVEHLSGASELGLSLIHI